MLCMLSGRDLLPQSLPRCVERFGAGCVTLMLVGFARYSQDRSFVVPARAGRSCW
jgi:hypothetical protein